MQPLTDIPYQCSAIPLMRGNLPRVGLRPRMPQKFAGMRVEPRPSVDSATCAIRVATVTALPPDDPPGERCSFHGLRATPKADSVKPKMASSGIVVLPTTTAPAARRRRTHSSSDSAGASLVAREPWRVGSPATSKLSLIATATPASGNSARSRRRSTSAASASAFSRRLTWNACSRPSSRSISPRQAPTVSVAEIERDCTADAMSRALANDNEAAFIPERKIVMRRESSQRDDLLAGPPAYSACLPRRALCDALTQTATECPPRALNLLE